MPFSKVNASSHIVESHQGMLLTQSAVDKFQVSTGQYYSPLVAQVPASIITSEPSTSKKRKIDREGTAEHKCVHPGCELAFKRRGNLNAHMLTHTGERPFQCDSCEKCFSRNHDLTRHRKGHTGARPFVCTRCNRGFARADALRRHTSKDSSCKRSTRTERRKTKAK
ncbi:hypothetical protein FBU31_000381 [Coemansia sp. 'formosensis']|nr:hypothetical protein FBU31_000381 [Coemansia sp. 'formosensis']